MFRSVLFSSAFLVSVPLSGSALADINVSFNEGAPKDRFVITNLAECALGASKLTLDLSGSASGLIFDVTDQGGGVEVFQPFELVSGAANLSSVPVVRDGDNAITLEITKLESGQSIAFTIDVDDTMGGREITVSNSEIEGASVRYQSGTSKTSARFSNQSEAVLPFGCTS